MNLLSSSVESLLQWRTEDESQSSETNCSLKKVVNLVEAMMQLIQARFPMEDDGETLIRPHLF